MKSPSLFSVLVALAVFAGGEAFGQEAVNKQTGGEGNIEVLFAPLGASPVALSTVAAAGEIPAMGGIKYRRFTSATTAWRVTFLIGFDTDKQEIEEGFSTTMTHPGAAMRNVDHAMGEAKGTAVTNKITLTNSTMALMIAPGMEWHFASGPSLSPYMGGEVFVGYLSYIENRDYEDPAYERKITDGTMAFGANAIAGMDWYFTGNIYMGLELAFGAQFSNHLDTKTTFSGEAPEFFEDSEVPNGNTFGVSPNAVGKIRLGFLF